MSLPTRPHPANVPTLTEVIELTPDGGAVIHQAAPLVVASPLLAPDVGFTPVGSIPDPMAEVPGVLPSAMVPLASIPHVNALTTFEPIEPEVSEAQLSQRILTDVQRQIDSMLEFRLRESMQPLLAQFTETLMQDLRDELSRTMRDVVTRAVAQEVAKLRNNR